MRRLSPCVRILPSAMVAVALLLSVVACPRGERKETSQTPSVPSPPVPPTSATLLQQWDSAVGPALLLATDSFPDSVSVVRPELVMGHSTSSSALDPRGIENASFDLFGRGGAFGSVRITALPATRRGGSSSGADTSGAPGGETDGEARCLTWPTARVAPAKSGWRIALASGHAASVLLDSVEAMSPGDSALVTATVARLASALPGADASFQGIPYTVRSAYRFHTAVIDGLITSLSRGIPSEATPREEHLFLVAERPVGGVQDYRVAYSLRSTGKEEATAITDVLAVVTLTATRRPVLLVSNEQERGATIGLIERIAPGVWQLTWQSAYVGC